MAPIPVLTEEEKEHFLANGWLKIAGAFTKEQSDAITANVWTRLGMSPDDKSTWTRLRTNMPHHKRYDASEFAPRAWAAICELCGGEERIDLDSKYWRDSLIVNLGSAEREGQPVPPRELDNWHVDGDFFVHYLDSPEQGMLVIPLFTDIVPNGGGTMICPPAIGRVARWLYDHPEGVSPRMVPRGHPDFTRERNLEWFGELAVKLDDETESKGVAKGGAFVEVTGQIGDVFLLHPLMLHSSTSNALRKLRIITNPPISLREPFDFNRPGGKDFSLVERTTLRSLGRDSLPEWHITAPRESVIPARVRIQEEMKKEELRRLQEATRANPVLA